MSLINDVFEIVFEYNEYGSVYIGLSITNQYKELHLIDDFLLDTGATSTIINYDAFSILKFDEDILKKNLSTITLADGSKRDTSIIIMKSLKIGIINFSNFPVRVLLIIQGGLVIFGNLHNNYF